MRALVFSAAMACCLAGCGPKDAPGHDSGDVERLLRANEVALHSFSGPKDWDNDGVLDGVETHVEAIDHFGDPCKVFGHFIFELYPYRRASPDPKGPRIGWWEASMDNIQDHQQHWQSISRTYRFNLQTSEPLPRNRKYVMTVTLTLPDGRRLFDERSYPW